MEIQQNYRVKAEILLFKEKNVNFNLQNQHKTAANLV